MDFNLRSNMNQAQLQTFAEQSIQMEMQREDYMQNHEANVQMSLDQLEHKFTKRHELPVQTGIAIKEEMPVNDPNEKESTRVKRQKNSLLDQGKRIRQSREAVVTDIPAREQRISQLRKPDAEAQQLFTKELKPEMFAPNYVLEHFDEIRETLDAWKEHLRLYGEGGVGHQLLAEDQKLRLEKMRTMYQDGEQALTSALAALGFTYETKRNGEIKIKELKDEKAKASALSENVRLRKKLTEQTNMDEKVLDELLTEEITVVTRDVQQFRRGIEREDRHTFIRSQHMSHEYHYETVRKCKELIEKHPEQYQRNRAVVERIYHDIFQLMEVNGEYTIPSMAINSLTWNEEKVSTQKMRLMLSKRLDEQERKMRYVRDRAELLRAGLEHLLEGSPLSDANAVQLRDYFVVESPQEQQRHDAEANARVYSEIYMEKKALFDSTAEALYGEEAAKQITAGDYGRFMMLMESDNYEHNVEVLKYVLAKRTASKMETAGGETAKSAKEELATLAKPLVIPLLKKMMDFDMQTLESCSDEELIARSEELQQLYISGMQISDMAKLSDPDDPEGRSIKEAFVGDRQASFAMKCSGVQYYAVKARMLAMVKAYTEGALTEECFAPEELSKIRAYAGIGRDAELSMNHMFTYVRDALKKNEMGKDAYISKYFHSQEAMVRHGGYPQFNLGSSHQAFDERKATALHNAQSYLGKSGIMDAVALEKTYTEYKQRILEIRQELQEMGEDELGMRALELQAELEQKEGDLEYLEMEYSLTRNMYRMTGDDSPLIREPIFRSYDSADSLDSFRTMGEENFVEMIRHLSAGALAGANATPEELEEYRRENVQGLLMYKERMREHYEMLEERFHHQKPSIEYIIQNYEEMQRLFANIQVDTNLVTHSKDMIDLRNADDARLYHLVQTYNALGGYILGAPTSAIAIGDFKIGSEGSSLVIQQQHASFEFLDKRQEGLTREEEDARAEEARATMKAELERSGNDIETARKEYAETVKSWSATYDSYLEREIGEETEAQKAVREALAYYKNNRLATVEDYTEQNAILRNVVSVLQEHVPNLNDPLLTRLLEECEQMLSKQEAYSTLREQGKELANQWKVDLEAAESPVFVEEFRTLFIMARDVTQATIGMEQKMKFIVKYKEFQDYLAKNEGVDSEYMTMYRRWSVEMEKQCKKLIVSIYHSVPATESHVDLVKTDTAFEQALIGEDLTEYVNAHVELEKLSYIMQEDVPIDVVHDLLEGKSWQRLEEIRDTLIGDQLNVESFVAGTVQLKDGKTNGMPVEKRREVIGKYIERFLSVTRSVQAEIQKLIPQVPDEIPQEDKELFALQMIMYTELGKEFKVMSKIMPEMRIVETNLMILKEFDAEQTEINALDEQVLAAKFKYGVWLEQAGLSRHLGDAYVEDFKSVVH